MSIQLAERTQRIQASPTLAVAQRAEQLAASGVPIINLSVGEPDFDTPDYIKQAAIQAVQAGKTKYTAVDGIKPLKEAIVQKFSRENQLSFSPDEIIVSCGAKQALFNAFSALLNPGDEVIIPTPFWVSYPDMVKLVDAIPVFAPTNLAQAFKLNPDTLSACITPKTKLFILNSPSNPSGMTYSAAELTALADVFRQHPHIQIISDDIYEHLLFEKSFCSILSVAPDLKDRVIVVNGVSKTYAMTGWRIGYAAGNKTLIQAMKKIQSQSTSNPCSIAQYAALAALNGGMDAVNQMRQAYRERHDVLLKGLKQFPELKCLGSDGTFYSFVDFSNWIAPHTNIPDDIALAEYLLQNAHIASIAGSAFGCPNYLRFSFATDLKHIHAAIEQLKQVAEKIK